ncbi:MULTISPECIES: type IV secretory system conjugative DNA transfer family protein [Dyella]|uniref:Type IV secretory system conjugative DNA transfer family protein n=2 Tax=Dyella TaxID=231454 RepID=A0A4R0YHV5_9GAMM|nr:MULTISPECIES: type IV secretory system conjugative DNA transfer family protein [Dyella]TBR36960.1 type IV secretory system conjugative DNA transfer family protein [Dyella terrae]TCI07949.1 type IV secretory system conjugative DNA transfer family protein [Dyella soli]
MQKWRIAATFVVAGVSLLIGEIAAGYILSMGSGVELPDRMLGYYTLASLRGSPMPTPSMGASVIGAGLVGLGISTTLALVLAGFLWRGKRAALHGSARFAGWREIRAQGLVSHSRKGLILGKARNRLIRMSGQRFAILAAPTRSGKGVGIVIPNLLDYQDSVVVLDIKLENFELTSGWRALQGQKIHLFNPFAEDRCTRRWNPLSYVSAEPSFRVSDLMTIAATLYPDVSDDHKFWVSQARNAFMAFTLFLFEKYDGEVAMGLASDLRDTPTLGRIYRLSSGRDATDLRAHILTLSSKTWLSDASQIAFSNLLGLADETFASVMGTFKEPLNAWINPTVDAATSADDFLLTDVRKVPMTIYVGIQPNRLAEAKLILNLFFSQLIQQNTKELPQSNSELRHQCLLLMDEFTSIGRIDIVASAVSYMAGYNLRLFPIIQSMSQLSATYGKDVARTLITNHAAQIVFTPREQQDAQEYSEMLGYTTVRRSSVTRGRKWRDRTRSASDERRALMLPQEIKAMSPKNSIIFLEGLENAILCKKIRYYEDSHFSSRVFPKIEVPRLEI